MQKHIKTLPSFNAVKSDDADVQIAITLRRLIAMGHTKEKIASILAILRTDNIEKNFP